MFTCGAAGAAAALATGAVPDNVARTSPLVTRPSLPEPPTSAADRLFSAINLAAEGIALALADAAAGAAAAAAGAAAAGAGAAAAGAAAALAALSIFAIT